MTQNDELTHDSFLDDPVFTPMGRAQTLRYYRISELDGTPLGALYLGEEDGFCAFIPVDSTEGMAAAKGWNDRAMMAVRAVGHGRDAFPFWYEAAGQTYLVGPIRQAASVVDLRRTVQGA